MNEQELGRAFHTAFDRARPSPGAEDRAFDAVAAAARRPSAGRVAGRRLVSAAAIVLAILVIATLALARGELSLSGRSLPGLAPPHGIARPTPRASVAPVPPETIQAPPVNAPDPQVVAASDRVALAGWTATGVLELTIDAGATWKPVALPLGPKPALLDVQWIDRDTAFISTNVGLFRLEASAAAWSPLTSRTDLVRLDFTSATNAYAVTASGDVVLSKDSGMTFTTRDIGIHPVNWVQWVTGTQAWAAGPGGIVATADGGQTWALQLSFPQALQTDSPRVKAQVGFRDVQNGFAMFSLAAGAGFVVYHTSDGGVHWVAESCACGSGTSQVPDWLRQAARSGLPANPHSALVVTGVDQALVISDGGSASGAAICTTTDDGSQWSCRAAPYRGGGVGTVATRGRTWWLAAAPPGSGRLIAMSQDAGASWSAQHLP